jgi:hypothetical protein
VSEFVRQRDQFADVGAGEVGLVTIGAGRARDADVRERVVAKCVAKYASSPFCILSASSYNAETGGVASSERHQSFV